MNQLITEVFVEQSLALPGSANNYILCVARLFNNVTQDVDSNDFVSELDSFNSIPEFHLGKI